MMRAMCSYIIQVRWKSLAEVLSLLISNQTNVSKYMETKGYAGAPSTTLVACCKCLFFLSEGCKDNLWCLAEEKCPHFTTNWKPWKTLRWPTSQMWDGRRWFFHSAAQSLPNRRQLKCFQDGAVHNHERKLAEQHYCAGWEGKCWVWISWANWAEYYSSSSVCCVSHLHQRYNGNQDQKEFL